MAFFTWLAAKAAWVHQIDLGLEAFNQHLIKKTEEYTRDTHVQFEVTLNIHPATQALVFAVERRERVADHAWHDRSRIIIARYIVPIEFPGHSASVSCGLLETFPDIPRRGKWQQRAESTAYTYAGKGWAALLFHISIWVTSVLQVERKVSPDATQTHELIKRYRGYDLGLRNGEMAACGPEVIFPFSDALTMQALKLMKEWLRGTPKNLYRQHSFGASAANPYLLNTSEP